MKADRITFTTLATLAALVAFAAASPSRAQEVDTKTDPTALLAGRAPVAAFSFRAEGVPIRQALALFARANKLNIVPDNDIEGDVTVDFEGLPLDLAMRALIEASGYYFVQSGGLIRVRNRETRLFQIDYINTTRTGQGASAMQIGSASSSGGGGGSGGGGAGGAGGSGGGGGDQGSTMSVTATATNDFWGDLTTQLQSLLSENGRVTINRLAGTVMITDSHRNIETVAEFLTSVSDRVVRQVDIEVQIYEVGFSHNRQVGVDWTRIATQFTRDYGTEFFSRMIVRNNAFGPDPLPNGVMVSQDISEKDITAVVEALEQQGDVKVVSKPRLRTLNNQPAVVRVGQDLPVFLREAMSSTGDNPVLTENYTIQNVTVGTVLSITPQISADGIITLDLTPAVTRLVRYVTADSSEDSPNAPVIDVRQATSLVRVRDGDTIILGGLVQEGSSTTVRKVPLLGDIPGLGKLFRGESTQKETTELIFFITPRIVSTEGPAVARGAVALPRPTPGPEPAAAPAPGEAQKPVRQPRK